MIKTMADNLNIDYKDEICSDMLTKADTELLDSIMKHGIDCEDTMTRHIGVREQLTDNHITCVHSSSKLTGLRPRSWWT